MAKKVNIEKSEVRRSGNPFYEYDLLKKLADANLPAAKPIAKYEENGEYLFVTEKIAGLPANQNTLKKLRDLEWTDVHINQLQNDAEKLMAKMQAQYAKAGFVRAWKIADMVMQVDYANKTLTGIVPTDWEKTKYTGG